MSNYYREYSPYLVARYGERVYKVPVTLAGGTCPNRDGTVGVGGCIFATRKALVFSACRIRSLLRSSWRKIWRFTISALGQ